MSIEVTLNFEWNLFGELICDYEILCNELTKVFLNTYVIRMWFLYPTKW
jgi:hypothetical protein